jgi:peptidyl-tRNA hydrolase, PTH1 family
MMWINKLWGKFRNQIVNEKEARPLTESMPPASDKFLIVGLGNTGRKYQRNRHNVGFMIVDRLAELHGISVNRVQNKALVGNGRIANHSVILAKPQTMMNLSGDAVGPIANYYNIPPANVLVIYDELDLPFGTIRLREKGGAGGHNGMKSIINHLGNDFPRLRLGIGRPPGRMPPAAYVLQDFAKEDEPVVVELIDTAVQAVATFLTDGIDLAMSRHNKNLNAE